MTWVKLDDQFPDDPKVLAAGELAAWLWICGRCYCSKHLTDGFIPAGALPRLTSLPKARTLAAKLVSEGLWVEVDDGWHDPDYTREQRTRADVEHDRAATRERVKKHRDQRRSNGVTAPVSNGHVARLEVEVETETNPSGGQQAAPPTAGSRQRQLTGTISLVAVYVDEYRATHHGENPIRAWRDQAGQHSKNLLDEGIAIEVIAACLIAIAHENKSPTALAHVLADYQAEQAKEAV